MAEQPRIFISYSHKNKATADEIDKTLQITGLTLVRDVRDLGYRGDVKKFMERVRESDFVLMLLGDDYLRSPNCMYEVLELVKDPDYKDRILPVLLEGANIFTARGKASYEKYWHKELDDLKSERMGIEGSSVIDDDIKVVQRICTELKDFFDVIGNMLHRSYSDLKEEGYKSLLDAIGFGEKSIWEELIQIENIENKGQRMRALDEFSKRNPNHYGVPFVKAAIFYESGDPKTAIDYFTDSAVLNRLVPVIYNNRAIALMDIGKYDKALSDYGEAVHLDPEYALAYFNRGVLYAKMEESNKALSDYSKAISFGPEFVDIYINRGALFFEMGEFEKALSDYNYVIQVEPENASAYFNRALVYTEKNNLDLALTDLNTSIKLGILNAGAYGCRGIILKELGEYKMALADFEQVLIMDVNDTGGYYHRGLLRYDFFDDPKGACEDWKKACDLGLEDAQIMIDKFCKS